MVPLEPVDPEVLTLSIGAMVAAAVRAATAAEAVSRAVLNAVSGMLQPGELHRDSYQRPRPGCACVTTALRTGLPCRVNLQRLADMSAGEPFPSLGARLDAGESGPLGPLQPNPAGP
jgi:hypothetical protein